MLGDPTVQVTCLPYAHATCFARRELKSYNSIAMTEAVSGQAV